MSNSQATYNPRFNFKIRRKATVDKPAQSKAKRVALALILLLLVAAVALGLWLRGDPQLAKVMALRDQMENADRGQRRELWGQMREEMSKLSPEAREALFAERRKQWEARQREQMHEFFAMSKEAQIASIDKDIDRMERRRKAWEERQAQSGKQGGQGGGPGGPGGRGGGGNSGDPLARAKNYLNNTTPEDRAERGEHRRMMRERRQQRGLGG